jgi:replicative DNA helicase
MKRKDTKYINFSEFEGFVAPKDIELEKVLLGSLLLEKGLLAKVEQFLEIDTFYLPQHIEIYRAIIGLANSQQPYDIMTVTNKLRADKQLDFVGGAFYIAQLTNRVGGTGNVQSHAAIIRQKSIQRKLIAAGYDMVKVGYDDTKDCFDAIDAAEASVKSINVSLVSAKSNLKTFRDLIIEEANAFDAIASGKNIGVKVNIENLDKHTNGWQNGNLIIIAARPSVGKSVLALNNAKEAAKNKVPTAMFSLEMSSVELMQRLASDEADVDFSLVQKAKTTDEQRSKVNLSLAKIENLPLYIDDTAQTTVLGIWNKATKIKNEYGLGLIVIDYIQLISAPELGNYADANTRVSHITRNLKLMAKELNVPVIALSQLSRDVEKRGGMKKPMLSDLRDSGSIEQDADVVVFPWRPSYYGITNDGNGFDYREDYAELIFAKHRNGVLGSIKLSFNGSKQRFTSYQDGVNQPNFPVRDFTEQIKPNNNFDDENNKPF